MPFYSFVYYATNSQGLSKVYTQNVFGYIEAEQRDNVGAKNGKKGKEQ